MSTRWKPVAIPLLLAVAISLAYAAFGQQLIGAAYRQASQGGRGALMAGASRHPLEIYTTKGRTLLYACILLLVLVSAAGSSGIPLRYLLYLIAGVFVLLLSLGSFGEDLFSHLYKLREAVEAWRGGHLPGAIIPGGAHGKGLPIFTFYSSWVYLPAALLSLTGLSLFVSLKLELFLFFVLTAVAIYRLLRCYAEPPVALAGSLLYLTANYILGNIFFRCAVAECAAQMLAPACLLAIVNWERAPSPRAAVCCLAAWSLLFIAHPLSFMNLTPGAIIFALPAAAEGRRHRWRGLALAGGAVVAAAVGIAVLTAFRWLPAAVEGRYVYLHHQGLIRFRPESFVAGSNLLNVLDYRSPGILLSAAALAGLALTVASFARRRQPIPTLESGLWLIIALYAFLSVRESAWVWRRFDILRSNQFVWRMLLPLSLFSTLSAVVSLSHYELGRSDFRRRLCAIISPLALIMAAIFLLPYLYYVPGRPWREVDNGISGKVAAFETKESGWSIDEFLPDPPQLPHLQERISGDLVVIKRSEGNRVTDLDIVPIRDDGWFRLQKYWHPRYRVWAGAREAPFGSDPAGCMVIFLRRGDSTLSLRETTPGYVLWARIASGAGWLGAAFAALRRGRP